MSEYINRNELLKNINENVAEAHNERCSQLLEAILNAPTADVVEVRHGEWILWKPRRENRNATYKCSVCGKLRSSYYNDVGEWEYCPCGAKMDGERKEQT